MYHFAGKRFFFLCCGQCSGCNNIALLRISGELGLIDPQQGEAAGNAYREYRRLQHAKRLSATPKAPIPREEVEKHIAAVRKLWVAVFGS